MTESKAHSRSRSPLIDAPAKPWYSQQERSLIKQRGQQFYCCRLILKSADFIAVLQCRCPLAEAHTPCRNLYAPKLNGKLNKWKVEKGKQIKWKVEKGKWKVIDGFVLLKSGQCHALRHV